MKRFNTTFVRGILCAGIFLLFVIVSQHITSQDLKSINVATEKDPPVDTGNKLSYGSNEVYTIDAPVSVGKTARTKNATPLNRPSVGADLGEETEPNDTIGTADALGVTEGRIKGYIVGADGGDFYGPLALGVGDRVYAGVMSSFSAGSLDSILDLTDSGGSVIENDLNDGTFGTTSSVIAGTPIAIAGNYYLRVRENTTATIRPYYLYFSVKAAATPPTPEVESNNTIATANALPASGWVSGTRNPASDGDFFSMTLAAGDTVFIAADLDPERDNVQWNGRIGMALFGTGSTQILVIDDGSTGTVTNPLGEGFYMTVRTAGTYYAYIDATVAATAGPTLTYNMNVVVIPAESSAGCTTYASTAVPVPIADLALSSSTITVPATTGKIRDLNVYMAGSHTFINDIDFHLRSPNGETNDNGVFTDIGPATVGGAQTGFNWWANDEAGIPSSFAVAESMMWMPDNAYRLDWFDGEDPSGIWTLDMRDDATGDVGTLTAWSLEICTESGTPAGNLIYSQNFDGGGGTDGGYTHTGTLDEWERGLPATTATTVSPARAPFLTCNSGVNCWKTDLDGTYEISSTMDLTSPNLNLTQYLGTINLYWAMRYQMESATFDHAWVQVTEVGVPANTRRVWQWYGATMNDSIGNPTVVIPESAGWGRYNANISDFAGKVVQVTFHVDGDNTVVYPGMAVDDVQIYHIGAVAASVPVGGRVVSTGGIGIRGATVTLTPAGGGGETRMALTNAFGYYKFDDIEVGRNYIIQVNSKRYSFDPQVIFVTEEMDNVNFTAAP